MLGSPQTVRQGEVDAFAVPCGTLQTQQRGLAPSETRDSSGGMAPLRILWNVNRDLKQLAWVTPLSASRPPSRPKFLFHRPASQRSRAARCCFAHTCPQGTAVAKIKIGKSKELASPGAGGGANRNKVHPELMPPYQRPTSKRRRGSKTNASSFSNPFQPSLSAFPTLLYCGTPSILLMFPRPEPRSCQ